MNQRRIVEELREHYPELQRRFGVASLAVFGSTGRDEAEDRSDVGLLVAFEGPATFDGYFDLKFYLEQLLGRPVDLATEKAIRPELRANVERDLIRVA